MEGFLGKNKFISKISSAPTSLMVVPLGEKCHFDKAVLLQAVHYYDYTVWSNDYFPGMKIMKCLTSLRTWGNRNLAGAKLKKKICSLLASERQN